MALITVSRFGSSAAYIITMFTIERIDKIPMKISYPVFFSSLRFPSTLAMPFSSLMSPLTLSPVGPTPADSTRSEGAGDRSVLLGDRVDHSSRYEPSADRRPGGIVDVDRVELDCDFADTYLAHVVRGQSAARRSIRS